LACTGKEISINKSYLLVWLYHHIDPKIVVNHIPIANPGPSQGYLPGSKKSPDWYSLSTAVEKIKKSTMFLLQR
jgi:hypothetical protein